MLMHRSRWRGGRRSWSWRRRSRRRRRRRRRRRTCRRRRRRTQCKSFNVGRVLALNNSPAEGDPGSTVCVKGELLIDVPEICTVVTSEPATSVEYVTVYVRLVNVTTGYTALVSYAIAEPTRISIARPSSMRVTSGPVAALRLPYESAGVMVKVCAVVPTKASVQGLTFVHISAQRKHLLFLRGYYGAIEGLLRVY